MIKHFIKRLPRRTLKWLLRPVIHEILNMDIRVWGDASRLTIAKSARMGNTLFNVSSGRIYVGEFTFAGHNVTALTGRHDVNSFMAERMDGVPKEGYDIFIGDGVWIGSNVIILGPCRIGDHAVIAAGALVRHDVAPYSFVAGSPARIIRMLDSMTSSAQQQRVITGNAS